eukprot:1696665-Rhodomonas_salina.2
MGKSTKRWGLGMSKGSVIALESVMVWGVGCGVAGREICAARDFYGRNFTIAYAQKVTIA